MADAYLLSSAHADAGQITVDGDIAAVTYHDDHGAAKAEYATHLTVEDATSLSTSLASNIDSLIVERHVLQTFHIILSEVAANAMTSTYGKGV